MRLVFVVVYNIVEIGEIIGHGIGLACFLIWNLGCYLVLGLCLLGRSGYFLVWLLSCLGWCYLCF
jgi:hypothetical protein